MSAQPDRRRLERAILIAVWAGFAAWVVADLLGPPDVLGTAVAVMFGILAVRTTRRVRRWRRDDTELRPLTVQWPLILAMVALFVAAAAVAYALGSSGTH